MLLTLLLLSLLGLVWAQDGPRLPEVQYAAPAVYPPSALAEGRGAVVGLEISLSETGEILDVRVATPSGDPAFDEAALLAVRAFRFSPAFAADVTPTRAVIGYNFVFEPQQAPAPSVEGVVREAGLRTPLARAEIRAVGPDGVEAFARTDEAGRFQLSGLAPGPWLLSATAPGLRREVLSITVDADRVVEAALYLPRDSRDTALLADEELVIESERATSEISERRLRAEEIQYLPGTNGDVVKVVQNLPGVARAPLGIGQLIIRGTAPEDSRFFLDGTPIPLVFHFGGLTSILPSDAIAEVAYLPGNSSVRYGRLLGGLVDIRTDPELPERSGGYLSVDVYQSAVFIEQRLGPRSALTVSGRRSYIDAVLSPLLSSGDGLTVRAPRYYDGQVRLLTQTDRATWDVLGFFSDDQFRFLGTDDEDEEGESLVFASFGDRFQRVRARRTATLGGGWTQETALSLGPERRQFSFSTESDAEERRLTVALREEVARPVTPDQPLGFRLGADVQGGQDSFNFYLANVSPREQGASLFLAPALYAESTARLGPLTLIPGLRGDLLTYDTGYVATALDPRASVRLQVAPAAALKASSGRFSSFPSLRQVSDEGDGNPDLIAQRSWQSSAGAELQLGGRTRSEVTVFYNDLSRLVVGREDRLRFFTGPPPVGPFDTDPYANDGVGRVYGAEALLRYDGPASVGLLTVTVSRSERQDRPDEPVELFLYDQPLVTNALWSQQLPRNWRLGGRFRFGSGNPYTPVVNRVYNVTTREFIPVYGERSSARLPAFYSLDLRVDKTYTFRTWRLVTYLDLQNATFAQNPEVVTWTYDFSAEEYITSNPPLPVFGFRGEW